MKKLVGILTGILILLCLETVACEAWWWSSDPVPYVTSEDTQERVAEDIIRDKWEAKAYRRDETAPNTRVVAVKIIPQVDSTNAMNMVIRIDSAVTESELIFGFFRKLEKFMPALLNESKLAEINEFRIYGMLPMVHNEVVSEDYVMKLFLQRNIAQKISWDVNGYDLHHYLTRINDGKNCTYWIHGGILSRAKYLK